MRSPIGSSSAPTVIEADSGWRPVPELSDLNRPFWTSGAEGVLRLQRCPSCLRMIHPPALRCQHDQGKPEWVVLSGDATVESWTVNHHPFFPGFSSPYIIAFVNPIEDDRVRILTNLIEVDPADVAAGMSVRVTFEQGGDEDDPVYFPLFRPES